MAHEHGKMDIKAQEDAFNGFISFMTRSTVVVIIALILLAILGA